MSALQGVSEHQLLDMPLPPEFQSSQQVHRAQELVSLAGCVQKAGGNPNVSGISGRATQPNTARAGSQSGFSEFWTLREDKHQGPRCTFQNFFQLRYYAQDFLVPSQKCLFLIENILLQIYEMFFDYPHFNLIFISTNMDPFTTCQHDRRSWSPCGEPNRTQSLCLCSLLLLGNGGVSNQSL